MATDTKPPQHHASQEGGRPLCARRSRTSGQGNRSVSGPVLFEGYRWCSKCAARRPGLLDPSLLMGGDPSVPKGPVVEEAARAAGLPVETVVLGAPYDEEMKTARGFNARVRFTPVAGGVVLMALSDDLTDGEVFHLNAEEAARLGQMLLDASKGR